MRSVTIFNLTVLTLNQLARISSCPPMACPFNAQLGSNNHTIKGFPVMVGPRIIRVLILFRHLDHQIRFLYVSRCTSVLEAQARFGVRMPENLGVNIAVS